MGCGSSSPDDANPVTNHPLPKGHHFLAELEFLVEVIHDIPREPGRDYSNLEWLLRFEGDPIIKWADEVINTSTMRKELEEHSVTSESFKEWAAAIAAKVAHKSVSAYALQITWRVGKHASVADGVLAA